MPCRSDRVSGFIISLEVEVVNVLNAMVLDGEADWTLRQNFVEGHVCVCVLRSILGNMYVCMWGR